MIHTTQFTAAALANARKAATGIATYPGDVPRDLAHAYDVQDRIITLMAKPIAGWKVGRINGAEAESFGINRLAGPIFSDFVFAAQPNEVAQVPVYAEGFIAAEAEFMLRIGTAPDPAQSHFSLEEAAAHIDQICVGIEMASSPFSGINDHGAAVTASDLGNSKALVIGAPIAATEWPEYADWPVRLSVDGVQRGQASASGLPDGPMGAVRFLLEHLAARKIALHSGQWVSTGAITGVHQVQVGEQVRVDFGATYVVQCAPIAAIAVS